MKFRHRVFLRVSGLVLALSAMAGITSFAAADGDGPKYEIEVGGVTKNLRPGMDVMQGTLLNDGSCDFSGPLVITGHPTELKNSGKVTIEVTDDCSLVVSDLEWRQVPGDSDSRFSPQPTSSSGTRVSSGETEEFIGYADSTVTDYPSIVVNSVEAGIQYFDDGSEVWGGHSGVHDWYWFTGSGWVKDAGTSGESTTGPNVISTWTEGDFHNDNCPRGQKCRTKHRATFFTYPEDPRWRCYVYIIHWGLRHDCYGERIDVAD